jgi:hypothetical protein
MDRLCLKCEIIKGKIRCSHSLKHALYENALVPPVDLSIVHASGVLPIGATGARAPSDLSCLNITNKLPVKSLDTTTHSRVFLYFYYFFYIAN